jgi:hypothetical protein
VSANTRRTFVGHSLVGVAAAAVLPSTLAAASSETTGKPAAARPTDNHVYDPWGKLQAISNRKHQLWPVIYLDRGNLIPTLERDVEAAFEGGADAVVLEIGKDYGPLDKALAHMKVKYPRAKVGCDYLGGEKDPYGYITTFKLAKEYELDIAWTDFAGVDLIKELPEVSLHAIEAARPTKAF